MKILLIVAACVLVVGVLACCAKGDPADPSKPATAKPAVPSVPFQKFRMLVSNSSALMQVYECERSGDSVTLGYYNEFMGRDDRILIREIKGGKELQTKLDNLWAVSKVDKWNGFKGPNPPGVLDGGGFVFDATLINGAQMHANGTNNYPNGYGDFRSTLHALLTKEVLNSTTFVGKYFKLTLPESWVGVVEVHYDDDGYAFVLPREKNGDIFLFRLNVSSYCRDDRYSTCLGTIKDKDLFVSWGTNGVTYTKKTLPENLWAIYSEIEDKSKIVNTIEGTAGFVFEPKQ